MLLRLLGDAGGCRPSWHPVCSFIGHMSKQALIVWKLRPPGHTLWYYIASLPGVAEAVDFYHSYDRFDVVVLRKSLPARPGGISLESFSRAIARDGYFVTVVPPERSKMAKSLVLRAHQGYPALYYPPPFHSFYEGKVVSVLSPLILVLTGEAGSGKTTVAQALYYLAVRGVLWGIGNLSRTGCIYVVLNTTPRGGLTEHLPIHVVSTDTAIPFLCSSLQKMKKAGVGFAFVVLEGDPPSFAKNLGSKAQFYYTLVQEINRTSEKPEHLLLLHTTSVRESFQMYAPTRSGVPDGVFSYTGPEFVLLKGKQSQSQQGTRSIRVSRGNLQFPSPVERVREGLHLITLQQVVQSVTDFSIRPPDEGEYENILALLCALSPGETARNLSAEDVKTAVTGGQYNPTLGVPIAAPPRKNIIIHVE